MSSALPGGLSGVSPPLPPPPPSSTSSSSSSSSSSRRRHRRGGPLSSPPTRRPPGCPQIAEVFVTSRSDFRAQLRRCQKLLEPPGSGGLGGKEIKPPLSSGGLRGSSFPPRAPPGELRLHGLGLAVPRTINLALQLQEGAGGALRIHASTSSVPFRDPRGTRRGPPGRGERGEGEGEGGEGEGGEGEGGETPRHNSAIHIRICRETPCA